LIGVIIPQVGWWSTPQLVVAPLRRRNAPRDWLCSERVHRSRVRPPVHGQQQRDVPAVGAEEGKLYLFVAADHASKYAFARLMQSATVATARAFLNDLVKAVPYKIHTVLTDNGIQFADLPKNRSGPTAIRRGHPFDRTCSGHGIEHRLTKPDHPGPTVRSRG
jgi:hypothetical protein